MSNTEYFHSPGAHSGCRGGGENRLRNGYIEKGRKRSEVFGEREVSVVDLILKDQENCQL